MAPVDWCPVTRCPHWHIRENYSDGLLDRRRYWKAHMREVHGITVEIMPRDIPEDREQEKVPSGTFGLLAILSEIRKAPDPFKACGEWLIRTTNAITNLAKEFSE